MSATARASLEDDPCTCPENGVSGTCQRHAARLPGDYGRLRRERPEGFGPATTKRRDGHSIVVCGVCSHESIGDYFYAVWSRDERDAWYQHRLHVEAKHPKPKPDPLREFAEFVASLDDVEMRRWITLTKLIRNARKALDEAGETS